jgi:hypothetical protein
MEDEVFDSWDEPQVKGLVTNYLFIFFPESWVSMLHPS